ncbi:uncharacterized protein LAESUDRAFT_530326 [Laetiporus sulphureus 93-53]|uniref:Uncharacterized protein n=1 Tax=Laetiporus sulphureus 93-53 TaxID=1314785 RepID=A0A165BC75_9APHY|nr:uncharacterized protein LAESUDRAFT_530326 [Laetiporus sulphureus 93-53]KZT00718.1 hypothetical protein LAESUDRAFT_530326 [Laetiporus sulphureus 93-53]
MSCERNDQRKRREHMKQVRHARFRKERDEETAKMAATMAYFSSRKTKSLGQLKERNKDHQKKAGTTTSVGQSSTAEHSNIEHMLSNMTMLSVPKTGNATALVREWGYGRRPDYVIPGRPLWEDLEKAGISIDAESMDTFALGAKRYHYTSTSLTPYLLHHAMNETTGQYNLWAACEYAMTEKYVCH